MTRRCSRWQFSLGMLFVAFTVLAVGLRVTVAFPGFLGLPMLVVLAFGIPATLTTVVIYGDARLRVIALGVFLLSLIFVMHTATTVRADPFDPAAHDLRGVFFVSLPACIAGMLACGVACVQVRCLVEQRLRSRRAHRG